MRIPSLSVMSCLLLFSFIESGTASDYVIVVSKETQAEQEWSAVVDALVKKHNAVVVEFSDSLEEALPALKNHFDEDGVVALTAWIAFQNLSAKFNSALGAEENGLCKLPGQAKKPV